MILDQCAVKQFHKLDGMDEEWANEFGLNFTQMRYVQDAVPGSENAGYSQALLGVDGEWRGIEIRALPKEKRVIDFAPEAIQSTESLLPDCSEESHNDDEGNRSGIKKKGLLE
jgi:hypothetical protein